MSQTASEATASARAEVGLAERPRIDTRVQVARAVNKFMYRRITCVGDIILGRTVTR